MVLVVAKVRRAAGRPAHSEHPEHAETVALDRAPAVVEPAPAVTLSVLGGFRLRLAGQPATMSTNAERVLAFLAVRGRPQRRTAVASTLWIDSTDERAGANLRTALWKIRRMSSTLVCAEGGYLALDSMVDVDVVAATARARRVVRDDEWDIDDLAIDDWTADLLPAWDEDWILFERERLRQLRMHALEAACVRLTDRGELGAAIDAGLAAIEAEPLRESAHRALIRAHMAEGNLHEARRQYTLFRGLLRENLGVDPSHELAALVALR